MRKFTQPVLIICLIFCTSSIVFAQKEDLKTKLRDLRKKKTEITIEYEDKLHKINREAEDRMAIIKSDFRKARDECLADRHKKSEELRKDYEKDLKPMLKEEEGLVELIGSDAEMDFVKTKAERERDERAGLKR